MPFKFTETQLPGVVIIEPKVFEDERGFFLETYKLSEFKANGINVDFSQDNHSKSTKGVLRGLHFQKSPCGQAKLVRCNRGKIFDVAVDVRPDSSYYKKWFGIELSEENKTMLYIPEGFAHGFVVLSDVAEVIYKASNEYSAAHDAGIRWDDPEIGIDWPIQNTIVSEKDKKLPFIN
ncbi:MAG: dTDP-4-dehydrorhamnose 3,5-epimerase [Candidatus Melainabacteria bacterium GWF2_37_15]|nr:MAG: dTDP-4-dehydrorhamnose 3,5-epimerase [Candidatus Melainabacteria bacterium GWF2_37_15]